MCQHYIKLIGLQIRQLGPFSVKFTCYPCVGSLQVHTNTLNWPYVFVCVCVSGSMSVTALVTATTMGACCWSCALSRSSSSPTPSSSKRTVSTWMHPRSKHWHLIDYVLVRQRDLRDVLHTRVMPSADCHTDHRLVRCKLRLHFKPKPREGPPRKSSSLTSFSQLK